ncbi:MAG: hypothetical protein V1895_02410, partial [Parcubacteria group bacterium]
ALTSNDRFTKLEKSIEELAKATKAGFDEMTERFEKVDRGQEYLQHQVDAAVTHTGNLKREIRKRPSRKEFNSLKKRVVVLEDAIV